MSLSCCPGRHSFAAAWTSEWHVVQNGIGIGNEAIQRTDLWVREVTNDATSGADLIVPPGAYELSQQGREDVDVDDLKFLGLEGGGGGRRGGD